jgi:hypothetical protein
MIDTLTECPRCGKKFVCSSSKRCWCLEVDVPVDVQEELSREYDTCLCPSCLIEVSEKGISAIKP